jgi:hypothetical protein
MLLTIDIYFSFYFRVLIAKIAFESLNRPFNSDCYIMDYEF